MPYIYCITNKITQKRYIGQTAKSVEQRMKTHKATYRKKRTWNFPLYRAMRKYGFDNFIPEILEECSEEDLNAREVYWIDFFDTYFNGYNATYGGEGRPQFDYDKIADAYRRLQCIKDVAAEIGCCVDTVQDAQKTKGIVTRSGTDIMRERYSKKVDMLDKQTQECLKAFPSASEAARWLIENNFSRCGISGLRGHILDACRGIRQTAAGFRWQLHDCAC